METPPRDADGRVQPHDDADIPNEAYLVRYVHSTQLVADRSGLRRLSTGAFSRSSKSYDFYQSMSADLLDLILKDGLSPMARMRPGHEAVVRLKIGDLRSVGLKVGHDPKPDNPYHVGVWGVGSQHRKKLHAFAEWLEKPDDVIK
jgi:hypothetical protein